MGKGAGVTKNVSQTGPLGFVLPSYEKQVSEANRLYNQPGPNYFPGQGVAGFADAEKAGQEYLAGMAPELADYFRQTQKPFLEGAMNQSSQFLDPLNQSIQGAQGTLGKTPMFGENYLRDAMALPGNISSNPIVTKAIDAAMQPAFRNLTEQVLPNIRNEFAASGGYGGTRQSLAEGQAAERTTRGAQEVGAQMMNAQLSQAFNNQLEAAGLGQRFDLAEADRMQRGNLGMMGALGQLYGEGQRGGLQAAGMGAGLTAGMTAPGEILGAVGGQQRTMEQANIDDAIKKWNYEQNLPYQKLQEYANMIKGPFGGVSSSEVQAQPDKTSQLLGLITTGVGLTPDIIAALKKIGVIP
jgi:hypothetical protein